MFDVKILLSEILTQKNGKLMKISSAAAASNALMIASGASSVLLEEIAAAAPEGTVLWQQMFFYQDRSITEDLVRRAEKSGYRAIVVSVNV